MIPIGQVSLRTLTVGLIGLQSLLGIIALVLAAQHFRAAAFEAQSQTLTRVVAVASTEVLRQLEAQLFQLGTDFQARPEFREALGRFQRAGETGPLQEALQAPFQHGFSTMRTTDLVKLRVFDPQFHPVLESTSTKSIAGLPATLLETAGRRVGADRLKALGALWSAQDGAYYSVLLPIGGLRLQGYLEVIADPGFNLRMVEGMTHMPLAIYAPDGSTLYQGGQAQHGQDVLPLAYELPGGDGKTALRLVSLSDITKLNEGLHQTILVTVSGLVMLVGLSTLLVLAILNRFVFEPVRAMREEMGRCAEGDLSVTIGRRMLLEFSALADAFNAMARQLTAKIEQLNQLSHYDSLTGLANRHYFNETIQKEWRRAHRSREPLSLLMLDVDHFKLYNDHYGHVVGDDCLCAVAAVLRRVVRRATDLPARYGGEEFAILMPNTPLASAIELGEEILAALASASLPHAASPLGRVSVSIGAYACCAAEPCSPACLVEAADCALYEAKRAGRNRLVSASGAGLLEKCSSCAGALPLRQA